VNIRESNNQDLNSIREIHLNAFGQTEGPVVSQLACDILTDETAYPVLSLITEVDNKIVGHIIFSFVKIEPCIEDISAYILAPLGVIKEQQDKGIGKSLINHGLSILREKGAELVFVLGDPSYYSKFGFESAIRLNLKPPHELEYPEAWMVLEIKQGALERASGIVKCATSLNSPEHW